MTNQTPESVIAEALNRWQEVSGSDINLGVADYLTAALRAANMLLEPGAPDAATVAVERVRARLGDILPDWSDSGVIAVADILAALDGAPEPEWEYGYRGRYAVMHPTKAGQSIETPEITQRTPDNWLPEMGEIFRRRPSTPAGPWLPVEGEGKP